MILPFLLLACTHPAPSGDRIPLRVGWQTTWATQGQLAQALVHTEVLRERGLEPQLVGFAYGGPLNEGAMAGEVDVVFTADQPAITLASRDPRWVVVGRLMTNRVGTFVPPGSPVKTPADLRGRTLAIPFGAAAQRESLAAVREAGLDPKKDLSVVNLGLTEQLALVSAGEKEGRWGTIDAGSAWDPALAELEHSGRARTIDTGLVTSVVLLNRDFAQAHPGVDLRLMEGLAAGWEVVRARRAEADAWFIEASGVKFDPAVLDVAAAVEPNLSNPARVRLDEQELAGLQVAADFMVEAGLLGKPVDVKTLVRQP